MINELTRTLGWSLTGFFIGYFCTCFKVRLDQIYEELIVVHHRHDGGESEVTHRDERQRSVVTWLSTKGIIPRWLGMVILVLSLGTVAQLQYLSYHNRQVTACQAQFNADFAQSIKQRNIWATEDRNQLTTLITVTLSAKKSETVRQALEDYLASVKKNDELRAKNPLPNLEQRECGKIRSH